MHSGAVILKDSKAVTKWEQKKGDWALETVLTRGLQSFAAAAELRPLEPVLNQRGIKIILRNHASEKRAS
jgi:hypothetical protein